MSRLPNPSFDVNVDPVLGAIVGAVIVLGGGAAAYGATRDTTPDPAPPASARAADPVVERALAIVQRVDGTTAADGTTPKQQAQRAAAAKAAAAKGQSVDPFPDVKDPATASAGGTTTGSAAATTSGSSSAGAGSTSGLLSAVDKAKRAGAVSDAANAAIQKATGGSATAGSVAKPATGGGSKADSKAVARRLAAKQPARVTLRIATQKRRSTVNQRSLGLLVPNTTSSVARVVGVSSTNKVVTLRLRSGAYLTGKQSKGTMCVQRLKTGSKDCRLIRVRTGMTAVIRAPKTSRGKNGAVTALRVLSVWRGGFKLAE